MMSSAQLQRKSEQARERLADRLEELRYHVSPSTVIGDLLRVNSRMWEGDDVLPVLARTARSNPTACLLIAAGVGWLIVSETRGAQTQTQTTKHKSTGKRRTRNGKTVHARPARRKPSR